IVNIHTGLLDHRQAEEIGSTGVDTVSVDVVGSNETIRRVYGLSATVDDYIETLNSLREALVPHIVPHICVGLDFGKIRGEAAALEVARGIDPELVVILGLMPTPGTAMESVEPPSAEALARAVTAARLMCPESGVALGCMRPRTGKGRIEELAMKAGASRLVLPSRSTIEKAEAGGFRVMHLDGCCSIPVGLEARALRLGRP
ncbi:MAG: radical SAM protein, partial [Candidatus Bathyarchaeota archaeon]|nr:radical SAM protein [Candidatus Bathyarchaeota archaeon]